MKSHLFALVVDDDEVMSSITAHSLRRSFDVRFELRIEVFLSAGEALVFLDALDRNELPQIIFSDVKMPVMNGWQFLQVLNGDPRANHIPVLMVTSEELDHPETGVRALVERHDAAGYVVKPIDLKSFEATVTKVLVEGGLLAA